MATFDINNIAVYDDNMIDLDIIRNIIGVNNQEDAFYILDIGTILKQHKKWYSIMPKVFPHYAIKCNPNPNVIRILGSLNCKFDCASKQEMQKVMQAGVSCDRIIYANPAKPHSHITFAKKIGVRTMMIDNSMEVLKIKEIYPNAKLVIRVAIDGDLSGVKFSKKFGCKPTKEIITLMNFIKKQEMYLQGFSFHLGSPCWDTNAYGRGIEICKKLIKTARYMGFDEVNLIDIGGGFPAIEEDSFQKIAKSVNDALVDLDPSIEVISEPGRYYVETAFTLATYIHSKRIIHDEEIAKRQYYINDGVFGSFIDDLLGLTQHVPIPLCDFNEESFPSLIWGPTCDSNDCIVDNIMIQDLSIGDWIVWRNMGSYTISLASTFNGYTPSVVFPIIRRSALRELLNDIDIVHKSTAIENNSEEECESSLDIAQCIR